MQEMYIKPNICEILLEKEDLKRERLTLTDFKENTKKAEDFIERIKDQTEEKYSFAGDETRCEYLYYEDSIKLILTDIPKSSLAKVISKKRYEEEKRKDELVYCTKYDDAPAYILFDDDLLGVMIYVSMFGRYIKESDLFKRKGKGYVLEAYLEPNFPIDMSMNYGKVLLEKESVYYTDPVYTNHVLENPHISLAIPC